MKAPNLNIIANMMTWTTSDREYTKPMKTATSPDSLHGLSINNINYILYYYLNNKLS